MSADWMIRHTKQEDYPAILEIYADARRFMAEHGNPNQWSTTRPEDSLVQEDIRLGRNYVLEKDGVVEGVFVLQAGEDPTYGVIEDGHWRSSAPYHTIHRIASSGRCHGVVAECVNWCYRRYGSLRIDTHADNKIMQHQILKNGFTRSGIIYQPDGSARIAYERP